MTLSPSTQAPFSIHVKATTATFKDSGNPVNGDSQSQVDEKKTKLHLTDCISSQHTPEKKFYRTNVTATNDS